ncbi:MAG: molybdopterin molybdotransferase MoeA [Anaerolineae bacterium]|nr:MAG: molybdopterin molybdotransferase MoeA [Anaerolineae bacterium]
MTAKEMISVKDALEIILRDIKVLPSEKVPLNESVGRVLVQRIIAAESMPPFTNSSMDGYAVRADNTQTASKSKPVTLDVIEDISAGHVGQREVTPGTAARIMTGAPLPKGADAVIPVEDTSEPWRGAERPLPKSVKIMRSVSPGDYIRYPGEDILAGNEVLPMGHTIRPQEIGVLASLGISAVDVVRRPKVAVLATGDELIEISESLAPGKIRNSNSYTQAAQIRQMGAEALNLGVAGDSTEKVRRKLQDAIDAGAQLIVSSAGVSVGAHDVVKAVLDEQRAVKIWRVRMRPGKPVTYAEYCGIPYLGLPGNPVSAMVTFEVFARPVILKMAGYKKIHKSRIMVTLSEPINSDGRESYIRAVVSGRQGAYVAQTTGKQGSHMLMSLVRANALVIVPEDITRVEPGEQLEALMLDWPEIVF